MQTLPRTFSSKSTELIGQDVSLVPSKQLQNRTINSRCHCVCRSKTTPAAASRWDKCCPAEMCTCDAASIVELCPLSDGRHAVGVSAMLSRLHPKCGTPTLALQHTTSTHSSCILHSTLTLPPGEFLDTTTDHSCPHDADKLFPCARQGCNQQVDDTLCPPPTSRHHW